MEDRLEIASRLISEGYVKLNRLNSDMGKEDDRDYIIGLLDETFDVLYYLVEEIRDLKKSLKK